ncbi:MAG: hypothetical protein IPN58_06650 [Anaerolineales bacterium]|nr:hypothetical protein [Anaerolineales bacterium]
MIENHRATVRLKQISPPKCQRGIIYESITADIISWDAIFTAIARPARQKRTPANQMLAREADKVIFMVAGIPTTIK